MPQPGLKAHAAQQFPGAGTRLSRTHPRSDGRQHHVFHDVHIRQQLVGLEDKPDFLGPHARTARGRQGINRAAVEGDLPGIRPVQHAEDVQQRAFTGPAAAHNRQAFIFNDGKRNPLQDVYRVRARAVGLADIPYRKHFASLRRILATHDGGPPRDPGAPHAARE